MSVGNSALTLRIRKNAISEWILFLYLTIPVFNAVFSVLLSPFRLDVYSRVISIVLMLSLYVLLCVEKRTLLVPEFWVLYLAVILFFVVTYFFHPEYEYWYTRSDYGVVNYVLRPDNGIFLYLFIRLVNDPKKILKTIKVSAWPIYLWYGFQVMQAISRGYWIDTSNKGYEIHMSYNLSLGYNVLIFVLPFLYGVLEEKKRTDIIGSIVGVAIMLIAGSRGPFLDIGIFFIIYIMIKIGNSRRKALMVVAVAAALVLIWVGYPILLAGLATLLEKLHLSSRMVTKLISGEILDDSNRSVIWSAAIDMIKKNPLGYGAMGSRHVIYQYIYVAHPHQFFLEMLIDFGVIFGSIIIIWLGYKSVKLFSMKGQDEWKAVFLIFFARACQLLVSLTFWHSIGLWGVLAVGVCMSRASRSRREIGNGR